MLRDRVLWHEVVLGAVTLLFALTATFMGCAVAINGVACHGLMAVESRWAATLRVWDVTCNVLMALYANLHSCGQPCVLLLTAFALVAWRLNQRSAPGVGKAAVHAVGVQLPVLAALMHYTHMCGQREDGR